MPSVSTGAVQDTAPFGLEAGDARIPRILRILRERGGSAPSETAAQVTDAVQDTSKSKLFWTRVRRSILHAYDAVSDARAGIGNHFEFYNQHRPHSEHGGDTPDAMYFGNLQMKKAA